MTPPRTRPEGELRGERVRLRPPRPSDVARLAEIRARPEVFTYWRGGHDLVAAVHEDLAEPGATAYVIEVDDAVAGWIQWSAEEEPDYRCATLDLYLDPDLHNRGLGADAVRTVARHLVDEHGFHRLEIDPAADNLAAIACYRKVGFRRVGLRRAAERGNDGSWHDSVLMDLLAEELT
ncbi:MAG TPA: GNAT family protein [Acidimicrobiales bacterium]|nr:GNAT family protein [Acidimicrobiales bacterium]